MLKGDAILPFIRTDPNIKRNNDPFVLKGDAILPFIRTQEVTIAWMRLLKGDAILPFIRTYEERIALTTPVERRRYFAVHPD